MQEQSRGFCKIQGFTTFDWCSHHCSPYRQTSHRLWESFKFSQLSLVQNKKNIYHLDSFLLPWQTTKGMRGKRCVHILAQLLGLHEHWTLMNSPTWTKVLGNPASASLMHSGHHFQSRSSFLKHLSCQTQIMKFRIPSNFKKLLWGQIIFSQKENEKWVTWANDCEHHAGIETPRYTWCKSEK